jgi:hypothetical protein
MSSAHVMTALSRMPSHFDQPRSGLAGTALRFRPGVVIGGTDLTHECGKERGIGYFLEPLCLMCILAKQVREERPYKMCLRMSTVL